jgi:hypothetical protein
MSHESGITFRENSSTNGSANGWFVSRDNSPVANGVANRWPNPGILHCVHGKRRVWRERDWPDVPPSRHHCRDSTATANACGRVVDHTGQTVNKKPARQ